MSIVMLFTIWHSQNELGQLDGVLTCLNWYKERLAVQQEDGSDYTRKQSIAFTSVFQVSSPNSSLDHLICRQTPKINVLNTVEATQRPDKLLSQACSCMQKLISGKGSKHIPVQTLSGYVSAEQSSSRRHHWRNLLEYNQKQLKSIWKWDAAYQTQTINYLLYINSI